MWSDRKQEVVDIILSNRVQDIAIVTHHSPDGDAIGSALALEVALNKLKNKRAEFIIHDRIDSKFYKVDDRLKRKTNCKLNSYDCVIVVDCSNERRTINNLRYMSNCVIVIDHHPKAENFANIHWCKEEASTTILIYELLKSLNIEIDERIAQLLLMGIYSDTGNFKYQNTNSNAFLVSSDLLSKGASIEYVNNIFDKISEEYLKLLSVILNKFKIDKKYKIGYIEISRSDLQIANVTDKEAALVVDLIRNVDGVDITFLFIEGTNNEVRIRARSKNIPINNIMKKFNGGGHEFACGGIINNTSLSTAIIEVLNYTKYYISKK